jgi:hypothetical protein
LNDYADKTTVNRDHIRGILMSKKIAKAPTTLINVGYNPLYEQIIDPDKVNRARRTVLSMQNKILQAGVKNEIEKL